MKIAIIAPIKHLEDFSSKGTCCMCLAHLCLSSPTYLDYYRRQVQKGRFVILDNGLYEGSQVSTEDLIGLTGLLQPSEVIAPDVLFDGRNTFINTADFLDKLERVDSLNGVKVMVVIQGNTVREWMACYKSVLCLSPRLTIGLSKLSIPRCFGRKSDKGKVAQSRLRLLKKIGKDIESDKTREYHLLGGDNWLAYELKSIMKEGYNIRSNDSSVAVNYGMAGYQFNKQGKIDKSLPNYDFDIEIPYQCYGKIENNILNLLKIVEEE